MNTWKMTLMAGLAGFALMACDTIDDLGIYEDEEVANEDPSTEEPEDEAPKTYSAVLIRDLWLPNKHIEEKDNDGCRSAVGADGADIDAIALVDAAGVRTEYYFLDKVVSHIGKGHCKEELHDDDSAALGMADGSLYDGYVSLRGGWLAGEFEFGLLLAPDMTLTVYEVGVTNHGATGEDPYAAYAITDLSCLQGIDPNDWPSIEASCSAILIADAADGESAMALSWVPDPTLAVGE